MLVKFRTSGPTPAYLFHDGRPYQWTGFFMIGTSVMKELTFLSQDFDEVMISLLRDYSF